MMRIWLFSLWVSFLFVAACASNPSGLSVFNAEAEFNSGDYGAALRDFQKLADQGNAEAEEHLGYLYASGLSGSADYQHALYWYRKAAAAGRTYAMTSIGGMYELGRGVEQDDAEGLRWFRKAADLGDQRAMSTVGFAYQMGYGVPKDGAQALVWYQKALDAGSYPAADSMGYMYMTGDGVDKDVDKGLAFYQIAADNGDRNASLWLGSLYEHGYMGKPKDEDRAQEYYAQVAAQPFMSMDELTYGMRAIIDAHKTYPPEAVKAKAEGLVELEFDWVGNTPSNIHITRSSGNTLLDQSAVDALKKSVFPRRTPNTEKLRHFIVTINFTIGTTGNPEKAQ